jgi:hypothetical protein
MSDLPSGAVTFLLTDIEGSSVLWECDRAAKTVAGPPRRWWVSRDR